MASAVILYGVTIHNAIKKGDKNELQKLLKEAKNQHGELSQAIKDLEKSLGSGGGYIK